MNKDSAQTTETAARKYETPRLVDYGRLHSQTAAGSGHSFEVNPGQGGGDVFRP